MPEPDVALLHYRDDFYASGAPTPADILLLVEVADSTLAFDRSVKLPLYAENGIREYWIVNLVDEWVELYRQPQPTGFYAQWRVARWGERIAPLAFPDQAMDLSDLLGPPSETRAAIGQP